MTIGIVAVHGLIHLLGSAKGFGWATVDALSEPITPAAAWLWLLAAALVLASAVTLALGAPGWWWALAVAAAVLSQVMVISAWSDAKAGTAANVVLLIAAIRSLPPDGLRSGSRSTASAC